jgi:cysteine-S-conjugate beta-lyase
MTDQSKSGLCAPGLATRLVRAGRKTAGTHGTPVNPGISRGSTLLFSRAEDLYDDDLKTYGLEGLEAQDALRAALAEIEGGKHCVLTSSGLAACTLPLLALLKAGDHVLVTDSVYGPTRRFCENVLARFGVETTFFDPLIGPGIEALVEPNTRVIFLESPGSLTLEVQDVPAIVAVAKARGILTMIDNTWSAGVLFRAFDHGIDVSIQAATKFQSGHSDALVGACITVDPDIHARIKATNKELGSGVSADEAWLVLRGLRTMQVRMERQSASAVRIVDWLAARPEVKQILWPAHPDCPGHASWKRDFLGSAGLFSIVLQESPARAVDAFVEALELFGLGFSWGGFESLIIPVDRQLRRSIPQSWGGPILRLSIGLEDPGDLMADLERGFAAWGAT